MAADMQPYSVVENHMVIHCHYIVHPCVHSLLTFVLLGVQAGTLLAFFHISRFHTFIVTLTG